METVRRKSLLYRSGLGFWCANPVQGCSHGCRYPCYAYLIAKRYRRARDFTEWRRPRIVGNAIELVERELAGGRGRLDRVHLSLTTDPFMFGHPEIGALSLGIVERLNAHGIPASILTKGLLPLARRASLPL